MYIQRPHENSPHNVDETTMKLFVIFWILSFEFLAKVILFAVWAGTFSSS